MKKEQRKYFNNLFRVKILKQVSDFEDGCVSGNVTRNCRSDNSRTLKLIEYGFEEGIKFAKLNRGKKWKIN